MYSREILGEISAENSKEILGGNSEEFSEETNGRFSEAVRASFSKVFPGKIYKGMRDLKKQPLEDILRASIHAAILETMNLTFSKAILGEICTEISREISDRISRKLCK